MLQAVAAKSNASTGSEGLDSRDLLRLLPKPEVLKVGPKGDEHQAWLTWWWQTRQYLVALDHKFDSDLKTIEENLNRLFCNLVLWKGGESPKVYNSQLRHSKCLFPK